MAEPQDEERSEGPEFPPEDVELAYERAGGQSWDDLLQYLESDPSEDFDDLSEEDLAQMAERVRGLMDAGEPYPGSAAKLRGLLESGRKAA